MKTVTLKMLSLVLIAISATQSFAAAEIDIKKATNVQLLQNAIEHQREIRTYLLSIGKRVVKDKTLEGSGSSSGLFHSGRMDLKGYTHLMGVTAEYYVVSRPNMSLTQELVDFYPQMVKRAQGKTLDQITDGYRWMQGKIEAALVFEKSFREFLDPHVLAMRALVYELEDRSVRGDLNPSETVAFAAFKIWVTGTSIKVLVLDTYLNPEISFERYGVANIRSPRLMLKACGRDSCYFVRSSDSDPGMSEIAKTKNYALRLIDREENLF